MAGSPRYPTLPLAVESGLRTSHPFSLQESEKRPVANTDCSSRRSNSGDNLVFRRCSALDKLGERLLDANRTIGQPKKITVIFGRKITKHYRGKLQTEIEDRNLPIPVIRSHYGNGFIKQYVRDIDDLDIVRAVGLKAA